ncbi:MAG: hypothetical protein Q7T11_03635, partial [Deltaproteobacteria bacterium]|nr:hypothetical protein [Deltaproteobacteria bacterium]
NFDEAYAWGTVSFPSGFFGEDPFEEINATFEQNSFFDDSEDPETGLISDTGSNFIIPTYESD